MSFAIVSRNAALPRVRHANFFDQFWNDFARTSAPARASSFVPHVEVSEKEEAYELQAELPGLDVDDFEVIVEDDVLTLKGEKKRADGDESDGARRSDSNYGSFERRLRFREAIPEAGVTATYRNGLLTVTLPKPVEAKPEVRAIPVSVA
jgi:HSP20 family protein